MHISNGIDSKTTYQRNATNQNIASKNVASQNFTNQNSITQNSASQSETSTTTQNTRDQRQGKAEAEAKSITETNKANAQKTTENGIKAWPSIVENLKQEGKIILYTNLINSQAVEINDMTVGISFPKGLTPFGKTILEKNENKTELEKRVSMEFGKPMRIKYIEEGAKTQANESQIQEQNPIETFAQDFDLPFNIIEE